jgi:hypothetical protein
MKIAFHMNPLPLRVLPLFRGRVGALIQTLQEDSAPLHSKERYSEETGWFFSKLFNTINQLTTQP